MLADYIDAEFSVGGMVTITQSISKIHAARYLYYLEVEWITYYGVRLWLK